MSPAKKLVLGVVLAASSLVACTRGGSEPRTALTSAEVRARNMGPSTRTIDNTGFIDNGGRSSDMTSRTEASGMRATETGSDRPTGTPGVGLPVPIDPLVPAGVRESSGVTSGAPSEPEPDTVARLTSAQCAHEAACRRIGSGQPYASEEACVAQKQDGVHRYIDRAGCVRGIDNVHLAICLGAVRGQACSAARPLEGLAQCRRNALCAP